MKCPECRWHLRFSVHRTLHYGNDLLAYYAVCWNPVCVKEVVDPGDALPLLSAP